MWGATPSPSSQRSRTSPAAADKTTAGRCWNAKPSALRRHLSRPRKKPPAEGEIAGDRIQLALFHVTRHQPVLFGAG
jgi:hypothetical protein